MATVASNHSIEFGSITATRSSRATPCAAEHAGEAVGAARRARRRCRRWSSQMIAAWSGRLSACAAIGSVRAHLLARSLTPRPERPSGRGVSKSACNGIAIGVGHRFAASRPWPGARTLLGGLPPLTPQLALQRLLALGDRHVLGDAHVPRRPLRAEVGLLAEELVEVLGVELRARAAPGAWPSPGRRLRRRARRTRQRARRRGGGRGCARSARRRSSRRRRAATRSRVRRSRPSHPRRGSRGRRSSTSRCGCGPRWPRRSCSSPRSRPRRSC